MLKTFQQNEIGRDFVTGDIHGNYNVLMSALNSVNFDFTKDRLFCAGDLVDRGENSLAVIKMLSEPWFFSVRGNHDDELVFNEGKYKDPSYMDAEWTENADPDDMDFILSEIRKLPYIIEVYSKKHNAKIGIVHGDCPSDDWDTLKFMVIDCKDQYTIQSMIWGRTRMKFKDRSIVKNIDHIYVGHTVVKEPMTLGNITFIDTGHVYGEGRKVTLIEI